MEAVDKLARKTEVMEAKQTSVKSDVKVAVKTTTTIGNKCNMVGTQMKDVIKQLAKLEKDKLGEEVKK